MFYSCPTGWRLRRCSLAWFIWSTCSRSATIPGVSGWPSVWHGEVITIRAWVTATWSASVRASVLWSGVVPVWLWAIPTVTLVIAGMWLGSGPVIPVPVPVMMPRSWSSMVPCIGVMSLLMCRCAWWWYSVWAICCYRTILITIKTSYMQAMCPDSWHWKHWSPSLDIILTVDEGNSVAVNCCTAWNFSTSLMASDSDWDPFS